MVQGAFHEPWCPNATALPVSSFYSKRYPVFEDLYRVRNQFSRNVYRDTPQAFAQDALALALAQELVASGQDRSLPTQARHQAS